MEHGDPALGAQATRVLGDLEPGAMEPWTLDHGNQKPMELGVQEPGAQAPTVLGALESGTI